MARSLSASWRRISEVTAARHGPTTISLERFVEDLAAVVHALGLTRFALVGHSLGDASRTFTRRARLRIRARAFARSSGSSYRRSVRNRSDARRSRRASISPTDDAFAFVRSFVRISPRRRRGGSSRTTSRDARRALGVPLRSLAHARPRAARSRDPLGGARADLGGRPSSSAAATARSCRAVAERMSHVIPRASPVEVPGAGHELWYEAPEAYLAAVARFLSRP